MIVLTPKTCGKEYAIDLHGDLAGILTESGDQKTGWQDDSCVGESSTEVNLSGKNKMVDENDEKPRK